MRKRGGEGREGREGEAGEGGKERKEEGQLYFLNMEWDQCPSHAKPNSGHLCISHLA